MVRSSRKSVVFLFALLAFLFNPLGPEDLQAHPGGVDANGGHYNSKTGEYHQHSRSKSNGQSSTDKHSTSSTWTGMVVGISDGDTIKVMRDGQQVTIRLYGVDTPEKKQAFGQAAKRFTAEVVAGKMVDVKSVDIDRYGRTVGLVTVNGFILNQALVRSGNAWVYDRYCKKAFCADWKGLETQARAARVGLWADPGAQAPWDWRRKN